MMFAQRDTLERRYDGPIPPPDPAAPRCDPAGRARLFQRLAHEARGQMAARRRALAAQTASTDTRLRRLSDDLRLYRVQGLAWRMP